MSFEQLDLFELLEEDKLTPRHWALYRLIYHNSIVEHRKTTQREICDKIEGYEWIESNNTSDHCSAIWTDVKDNNESPMHDKLIITKDYEYWIGSERETREFIKGLWKALSPRLKRYWSYLKKIGLDGQGKLLSNAGNVIVNVNERRVEVGQDTARRKFI